MSSIQSEQKVHYHVQILTRKDVKSSLIPEKFTQHFFEKIAPCNVPNNAEIEFTAVKQEKPGLFLSFVFGLFKSFFGLKVTLVKTEEQIKKEKKAFIQEAEKQYSEACDQLKKSASKFLDVKKAQEELPGKLSIAQEILRVSSENLKKENDKIEKLRTEQIALPQKIQALVANKEEDFVKLVLPKITSWEEGQKQLQETKEKFRAENKRLEELTQQKNKKAEEKRMAHENLKQEKNVFKRKIKWLGQKAVEVKEAIFSDNATDKRLQNTQTQRSQAIKDINEIHVSEKAILNDEVQKAQLQLDQKYDSEIQLLKQRKEEIAILITDQEKVVEEKETLHSDALSKVAELQITIRDAESGYKSARKDVESAVSKLKISVGRKEAFHAYQGPEIAAEQNFIQQFVKEHQNAINEEVNKFIESAGLITEFKL